MNIEIKIRCSRCREPLEVDGDPETDSFKILVDVKPCKTCLDDEASYAKHEGDL